MYIIQNIDNGTKTVATFKYKWTARAYFRVLKLFKGNHWYGYIHETVKYSFSDYILDTEWADEGIWRNYSFNAAGNTFEELAREAAISETDQDGGEITTYGLEDASPEVLNEVIQIITNEVLNNE